jgi:serine/tyrosine/threonine adenylyltransferase
MKFNFDNSYSQLPEKFFERIQPTPVRAPQLIQWNRSLADELNLEFSHLSATQPAELFSGNQLPAGAEPIAQAYSGHQFGHFSPLLGDGRAHLLGEHIDQRGRRFDIQLKGSGRTRFSRRGDGRAALGPMMREYILGEAMHALGIPSTRALALVMTGEPVMREGPVPGAVLTRVASSHIRVGTFEYFFAQNDFEAVKTLADYTLSRHFSQSIETENPYLSLFNEILKAQAKLVASWMHVGFIHGVMNTDNMAVSGETIDYGPCAFLDEYNPGAVFSSIDRQSRYAYGRQASVAYWNLKQLGMCLLKLFDEKEEKSIELLNSSLEKFPALFNAHYVEGMGRKLGLLELTESDIGLIEDFLSMLSQQHVDYTRAFERLSCVLEPLGKENFTNLFSDRELIGTWFLRWMDRIQQTSKEPTEIFQQMRRVNPVVIPRNHQIEKAIQAAYNDHDLKPFQKLVEVVSSPFAVSRENESFKDAPLEGEKVLATFCGT